MIEQTEEAFLNEMQGLYNGATSSEKALMKSTLTMSLVIDSKLDRTIKMDAMMAVLQAFAVEIELAAHAPLLRPAGKIPLDAMAAIRTLELIEREKTLRKRVVNILDLFMDEAKARKAENLQ